MVKVDVADRGGVIGQAQVEALEVEALAASGESLGEAVVGWWKKKCHIAIRARRGEDTSMSLALVPVNGASIITNQATASG